jgi:hypothetical protein
MAAPVAVAVSLGAAAVVAPVAAVVAPVAAAAAAAALENGLRDQHSGFLGHESYYAHTKFSA